MERKTTLELYKVKEAPMYERWYDGSLGGDLFRARAQCMDVKARSYKWSESRSKVCQMCDSEEDKTVEYVMPETGAVDPKARLRSDPESPVVSRSRSSTRGGRTSEAIQSILI
ncbi:hypothetical protein E2C01_063313 [Portunus trituberculatus]|uniref:Uncharacterized protein n=1 Tax=Portunus trituberculatus TaxID=210409 RepID=A0A5B7HK35_PORTR|nr:hypothetical protein [Portunus trituberculatus]